MCCTNKEKSILLFIIILGLALRLAVTGLAPVWAGPDEPSHYEYISVIAEEGRVPYAPEEGDVGLLNVTGQNPPLFHIMGAVFYAVSGNVHWIRMLPVLFGALCVLLTFFVAKELTQKKFIALGAALFIALLPTHIVVSATINNEVAAYAFVLASLLFMLKAVKGNYGAKNVLLAGLFFGLAFATRFNTIILGAPFLVLAVLYLRERMSVKRLLAFVPAAAIALLVLWGNYSAYGKFFPFRETQQTVLDFGLVTYFIPRVFAGYWLQEYAVAAIPEWRVWVFALLGVLGLAALVGVVKGARKFFEWGKEKKLMVAMAGLLVLANVAFFAFQNLFYYEPDARLLYPAVSIVAIGLMWGFKELGCWKRNYAAMAMLGLLLVLDLMLVVFHNTVLPEVLWVLP